MCLHHEGKYDDETQHNLSPVVNVKTEEQSLGREIALGFFHNRHLVSQSDHRFSFSRDHITKPQSRMLATTIGALALQVGLSAPKTQVRRRSPIQQCAPRRLANLTFVFSHVLLARGRKTHARPRANPTANILSHKLSPHCSLTTFHPLLYSSVQVRASAPQMFDVSPWKNIWSFDAQKACFDAWDPEKPRSYTNFNPFERNGDGAKCDTNGCFPGESRGYKSPLRPDVSWDQMQKEKVKMDDLQKSPKWGLKGKPGCYSMKWQEGLGAPP